MNDILEVVRVNYKVEQNQLLEREFRGFYKLGHSPRIEKSLFVEKESYRSFLGKKMRDRTIFEPAKPFSQLDFDILKHPFRVVYSKCVFYFPSSRTITLTERLDSPNGHTASVELLDSDGKTSNFDRYISAEAEVVARYLTEWGDNGKS